MQRLPRIAALCVAVLVSILPGLAGASDAPGTSDDAAIQEAAQKFASTGKAPTIERSDSVIYPFGASQPTLKCTPLRACDIELEAGEVVHGVALGDTDRWISSPLFSGDADALVPHVVVKPRESGISTNLIITTTRRTYHLSLVSPAKGKGSDVGYQRQVRFYYPGDVVQKWSDADGVKRAAAAHRAETTVASLGGAMDPAHLNFDYSLSGGHFAPFRPVTIFDDGRHTYIRLPPSVAAADAPAFIAKTDAGEEAILNYRMSGSWIVVDGLFASGELVTGVGRSRASVKITNRGLAHAKEGR